jgi:hypothetical protein
MPTKAIIINNFGYFPTVPPFSTAFVTGLLKKQKISTVHLDTNIEIWETLLSIDFLKKLELRERKDNEMIAEVPFCKWVGQGQFKIIKDNVIANIEAAKTIIRGQDFYDTGKLAWAANIIFQVQQLIYYHYGIFVANKIIFWPGMGFNVNSIKAIREMSDSLSNNPFIELFSSLIVPKIKALNPKIIGIDICFPWEVIQAVTLNKLLKQHLPDTHLNFIGHGFDEFCFARIRDKLITDDRFFLGFDSVFVVRNDEELVKLYSKENFDIENIRDIKSLAYKKYKNQNQINEPLVEDGILFDIQPDYDDLPLGKYYSPQLVLVDKLSNRCFWSKCTYCNINAYKGDRIEINMDNIIARIKQYKEKYGCDNLFLLDEAATPKLADRFSKRLLDEQLNISWSLRTRIDGRYNLDLLRTMSDAGCCELWIGLETVSERLLKLMNKTNEPSRYVSVAKTMMENCAEANIGLHFCLILGFPTESAIERNSLLGFFEETSKHIKKIPFFVTYNRYSLNVDSYIYKNYKDFGISRIIDTEDKFNMISTDYIEENSEQLDAELDSVVDQLTSILVKDPILYGLWYFASDSSWEMLLKEHHKEQNPFQVEPSLFSKIGVSIYRHLENIPFVLRFWNKVLSNKYMPTQSQLYR